MKGVFIPNIDGSHQFYIKADGEIRLKFNPNGNDATGAVSELYHFKMYKMHRSTLDLIGIKCSQLVIE